jgi:hemolysin III
VYTDSRPQSFHEELANAISHGLGFLLAAAASMFLMHDALRLTDSVHVLSVSIFSITMMLLYLASCLYHAWPLGIVKLWLKRLDHAAIFLFIAGSYTPFMLGILRDHGGWSLLTIVWSIALGGAVAKMGDRLRHPLCSTSLYVALGWLAIIMIRPLLELIPAIGFAWVIGGGAMYTLGAIVFHFDMRFRYAHFIWHLFVLGGSACHFIAVLRFSRSIS